MLLRAGYWLIDFGGLLLLWFLFTSQLEWHEAFVGIAAAVLGAAATEAVRQVEHPRFFPHLRWILEFWRVPPQIISDTWLMLKKLAAMIFLGDRDPGRFISVSFRDNRPDPASVARRSLAIVYTSISPNSIVVGINRARERLLLHMLVGTQAPYLLHVLGERR